MQSCGFQWFRDYEKGMCLNHSTCLFVFLFLALLLFDQALALLLFGFHAGPGVPGALVFVHPVGEGIQKDGQTAQQNQQVDGGGQIDRHIQRAKSRHQKAGIHGELPIIADIAVPVFFFYGVPPLVPPDAGIFGNGITVIRQHKADNKHKLEHSVSSL